MLAQFYARRVTVLHKQELQKEPQAAGNPGAVVAEVVVDPSGNVTDARIVQSIPLLDEAALRAVHNWHYGPTVVNGQPVPVRLTVTVNTHITDATTAATTPTMTLLR